MGNPISIVAAALSIDHLIHVIRGQKVMLDSDLASLYGVPTKALIQAVHRNRDRFPKDFLFRCTERELVLLRSQFVTSKDGRGGRRYLPYMFTEQGVAMLSGVLRSKRAVQVNIEIMRVFVRLRRMLGSHALLARKLRDLEAKIGEHDENIAAIFEAIRQLMLPPKENHDKRIGFRLD
jgi:hypothetical protein